MDPAADRRAARTRYPDAIALNGRVQLAAVLVFLKEGVEVGEQRHVGGGYVERR
jgi:hypothetical protein